MRLVNALTVATALGLSTVTVATADDIILPYPAGRPYYPLDAIEDTASPPPSGYCRIAAVIAASVR